MDERHKVLFWLHARKGEVEITPRTIDLHRFNRFNREVEEFLAGSGQKVPLDEVNVSVEDGSYGLAVFLAAVVAASVEPDIQRLERENSLDEIDPRRAAVVRRWQEHARAEEGYSVAIQPHGGGRRVVNISRETDFHTRDADHWVAVEKYVVGKVLEVGGSTRINVHLALEASSKVLIAASTEDYLRDLRQNYLYHRVQVHIAAQENVKSGELRDTRLLAFIGEGPSYDEDELNAAIEKGTRAWADVPNSVDWVREQRGEFDE